MPRCSKGTRKNAKTGLCEKYIKGEKKEKKEPKEPKKEKSERKRCQKGTRKNIKTGLCEKHTIDSSVKKQKLEEPNSRAKKQKLEKSKSRAKKQKLEKPNSHAKIITQKEIYKVIVDDPSKYNITTNSNKVNNSTIFKIEYKGCIRHFFVPDEMINFNFIYIDAHTKNFGVLVKINKDIDANTIETITTFIEKNHHIGIEQKFLTKNKIIRLQWNSSLCEKELKKLKAKKKIEKLNDLLKKKCDNLSLSLDYIYNMNGYIASYSNDTRPLLLCLNHPDKGCISSIELYIHGDSLTINSKTKTEFEGKKYNKLLRAATIIIAPLLKCEEFNSYSINPISTWLLMDSFNATTTDEEVITFLFKKHVLSSEDPDQIITKDIFTKELIREYHEKDDGEVSIEIDLTNPKNIERAEEVFNELINTPTISKQLKCH